MDGHIWAGHTLGCELLFFVCGSTFRTWDLAEGQVSPYLSRWSSNVRQGSASYRSQLSVWRNTYDCIHIAQHFFLSRKHDINVKMKYQMLHFIIGIRKGERRASWYTAEFVRQSFPNRRNWLPRKLVSGNSLVCNNGREGYTCNQSNSGVDYSSSVPCFPNSDKQGKVSKFYRLVGTWIVSVTCSGIQLI